MSRRAIFPMILSILLVQCALGQNTSRTISGLLTCAEDGSPLEGVRVYAKGSGAITGTMLDGMFYLPITGKDTCLLLSREDILPIEIRLTSATDYSVKLHTGEAGQVVQVGQLVQAGQSGQAAGAAGEREPATYYELLVIAFHEIIHAFL